MPSRQDKIASKSDGFCLGIVDDEPDVRLSLTDVFQSVGVRCRSYSSAESLLSDFEDEHFGCLVIDVVLPGISGLELQSELRRRDVDFPIIFISGRATISDAIAAFRNRASDFFEKPFHTHHLLETVQRLLDDWNARRVKQDQVESLLKRLSSRERQVMDALMAGKKTVQIAHDLNISASTVEKHRLRIFEKTGVDSIIELIHLTTM